MKLASYTTSYLAALLLVVISVWAALFYFAMLDEIYDSIDDGLDNQKGLIIQKAAKDTALPNRLNFEEGGYSIKEINTQTGLHFRDLYVDTSMYMQNEKDFEPVRLLTTVFVKDGRYYQLQISTSMVEEDDLLAELLFSLLWLYLGLVATILLLNTFLLKKIWKPFYFLLAQLKNFTLTQPGNIKVKETKVDEFSLLNKNVQKLLQKNIDTYNSQKQFIENASHELQTPLAISINKLEALAETADLSSAGAGLLYSALENLQRLTRLNRSLLLLSRIENKQFTHEETFDVTESVKKIVEDFDDQIHYHQLIINIAEEEPCVITMNPDLGGILLTNLVKNAIVHNHSGGSVTILITQSVLVIENSGNDGPLQEAELFTRFAKQKQSPTSTGLGLAIAKAISQIYSFNLSYSYPKKHTITLRFK